MSFSDLNLNNALRNAIEDLGLETPTPIQEEAFSVVMSGKDIVGIAQTGTGKTFAYLLPILRQLKYSTQRHPRVLIVVPTRELVVQVMGEIEKLAAYMTIRVKGAYGGVNINTQGAEMLEGMDIVVATPGRLVDLVLNRAIKMKAIRQLVIDEVDEMLNLGFRTQLNQIFELLPERRQNILFSATLTEDVDKIIKEIFLDPQKIEIASSGTPADGITQYAYLVPNFHTKLNLLKHLIQTDEQMTKLLVFAPTKKVADLIFEELHETFGEEVGVIHSNKSQNYRLRTVANFDSGIHKILIATDLIARGLDFEAVSHVINVDTPDEPENYVHRVGRTARANAEGIAITFVNEKEATAEQNHLLNIEELLQQSIEKLPFPKEEVETSTLIAAHEIIRYQQKIINKGANVLKHSQGAFHDKKLKNTKENRAQEKRHARVIEKKKAKRKKK
jgi:ATP-dependent RNA helicase RhlE